MLVVLVLAVKLSATVDTQLAKVLHFFFFFFFFLESLFRALRRKMTFLFTNEALVVRGDALKTQRS